MSRLLALAALVLLLAGCAQTPISAAALPAAALPDEVRSHPEAYIVVTVRNHPAALNPYAASTARGYTGVGQYRASTEALVTADRIAGAYRLRAVAAWPIEVLGVHCLVYALPPATPREPLLARLARDPDVESAQALSQFDTRTAAYNDPYAPLQTNLLDMGVAAAQQWAQGDGVRVAVIDTGVDTGHPDFAGGLEAVRDFVLDRRRAAEAHGTAVAGIIGARPNNSIGIAGIAPRARILALRACWTGDAGIGVCNTFTLAQALAAAIDARAQVVNLSIGGPDDPLLARLVQRGLAQGIVFVGAVPVNGRRIGFPTAISGVLAVGVAGRNEQQDRVLYAPGIDVFTLTPGGHYDVASGSSVAAAEVTALVALLLSSSPGLTAAELEMLLDRSAKAAPLPGPAGASVNACMAMRSLRAEARCAESGDALARTR